MGPIETVSAMAMPGTPAASNAPRPTLIHHMPDTLPSCPNEDLGAGGTAPLPHATGETPHFPRSAFASGFTQSCIFPRKVLRRATPRDSLALLGFGRLTMSLGGEK